MSASSNSVLVSDLSAIRSASATCDVSASVARPRLGVGGFKNLVQLNFGIVCLKPRPTQTEKLIQAVNRSMPPGMAVRKTWIAHHVTPSTIRCMFAKDSV